MAVITMTREMGSSGLDVAIGIAERLDLKVVHHELVEQRVASRLHLPESAVTRYLEGRDNVLDRWRLRGARVDWYSADEIFELALQDNVIMRGWGATQLLRPVPHVLSVRVCAPLDKRVDTLMKRVDLTDPKAARAEILANDAAQARAVRRISGVDWQDPMNYDLVLNTDRLSIEAAIEQILDLMRLEQFRRTVESRAVLVAHKHMHQSKLGAGSNAPGMVTRRGHMEGPVLREERELV